MVLSRRSYRIALNALALVAFVGIGGMQMYEVDGGFVTSYGADLLAPPILYFSFREGYRIPRSGLIWRLSPLASLLTVLGGCAAWEWSQRFDLSGTPLVIAPASLIRSTCWPTPWAFWSATPWTCAGSYPGTLHPAHGPPERLAAQ